MSPGLLEILNLETGMAKSDSRPTCGSSAAVCRPAVDSAVVSFGMGSHSKRRFVTRAVPDVKNLDAEGLLADVVEDAVGPIDGDYLEVHAVAQDSSKCSASS